MSATEHQIEDGIEGPAYVIVPISENRVTRAVFNAVANYYYGRKLQSAEEIEEVWDLMHGQFEDDIDAALGSVGKVDPLDDSDLERVYGAVSDQLDK